MQALCSKVQWIGTKSNPEEMGNLTDTHGVLQLHFSLMVYSSIWDVRERERERERERMKESYQALLRKRIKKNEIWKNGKGSHDRSDNKVVLSSHQTSLCYSQLKCPLTQPSSTSPHLRH